MSFGDSICTLVTDIKAEECLRGSVPSMLHLAGATDKNPPWQRDVLFTFRTAKSIAPAIDVLA